MKTLSAAIREIGEAQPKKEPGNMELLNSGHLILVKNIRNAKTALSNLPPEVAKKIAKDFLESTP